MLTEMTLWGPSMSWLCNSYQCKKVKKTRTRTQKDGRGLGYFYSILGVYDAYNPELGLENQSDMVYDIWERYWDTYSMIIDYYEKYPDQDVIIVRPSENDKDDDDGNGKMSADSNQSEEDSDINY